MRIGINEVLISKAADGAQRREMAVLPPLLETLESAGWESTVYFSRDVDQAIMDRAMGRAAGTGARAVRTTIPRLPTARRVMQGHFYWKGRTRSDFLDLFHTAYYPIPRLSVPVVLTVHDLRWINFPETYRTARLQFLRYVIPNSLKRATRIITVSEHTRQEILENFDIDPSRIDVAYNPVGAEFGVIEDPKILAHARATLKLPERFILYVGSLEPRKNLARLLQAYGRIRDRNESDLALVILGRPHFGYQDLIRNVAPRFAGDVLFTGYVPDEVLPAVYNLAQALAFPSLHEGFGIPVIEAMACGLPVLTSQISALPEVAGGAAYLVDPYDVNSIADGLVRVLHDTELRAQLVQRGFYRIEQFTPAKTAEAIFSAYCRAAYVELRQSA